MPESINLTSQWHNKPEKASIMCHLCSPIEHEHKEKVARIYPDKAIFQRPNHYAILKSNNNSPHICICINLLKTEKPPTVLMLFS